MCCVERGRGSMVAGLALVSALLLGSCGDADGNVGLPVGEEETEADIGGVDPPEGLAGPEEEPDGSAADDRSVVESTSDDAETDTDQTVGTVGTGEAATGADGDGEPSADDDSTAAESRTGFGFPVAPLTDLGTGDPVELATELSTEGGNVLLWFWEPGSPASLAEAEVVQRLVDQEGAGVRVVGIGVGSDIDTAVRFLDQSGLSGVRLVWDGTTASADQYEVSTLPTAILLDPDGNIIARWATLSAESFQLIALLS